jgi:DNA-binding LytR/AlgR family response regulator
MIRIAVCDDQESIVYSYKQTITDLFLSNDIQIILDTFTDGNQLIEEQGKKFYDLVFLDIDMPILSGFDTAKSLKSMNEDTTIIFVTNEEHLVYLSLKYSPFRFIRKPYFTNELEEAVLSFLDLHGKRNTTKLFNCNGVMTAIKLKDILYVESNKHKVILHIVNKQIETRAKIGELEEELRDLGFVRTHVGYLVNMQYVFSIEKSEVVLMDRTRIAISRHRIDQVKGELQKYIRGEM